MLPGLRESHFRILLLVSLSVIVGACGNSRPVQQQVQTDSDYEHQLRDLMEASGPTPIWSDPFYPTGKKLATTDLAVTVIGYVPMIPTKFGTPASVHINNPNYPDAKRRAIGWVFDHPNFGHIWVTEESATITQAELERVASLPEVAGSYVVGGVTAREKVSLASIRGGTNALLISGSKATSIRWLERGLRITLTGPSATFSKNLAVEAADFM